MKTTTKVSFKNYLTGKYMVAEDTKFIPPLQFINANRDEPNEWEKFEVIKHGDGKFSLKTWKGLFIDGESIKQTGEKLGCHRKFHIFLSQFYG